MQTDAFPTKMNTPDSDTNLHARLAGYRDRTLTAMLAALPTREPQRYLYGPLTAYISRMGKGLRPALCLATACAFGGNEDRALPSAAALEMLHNAFLIHDDIEDESEYRRTHPTLHTEQGIPLAVNAGDALTALSMQMVRDNLPLLGPHLTGCIFGEFEHLMLQSLEGQAMELGWIRDNPTDITEADYLRMVLKKTCWYSFIHPCRIGALIARGAETGSLDEEGLERFNRFGYYMGTAFQIQDDVLNLVGENRAYGKEKSGDLWEGKRTLMLVHLLRACRDIEADRLRCFLGQQRAQRSADDVAWVRERMHHYGSIQYARSAARHFAGAALHEFGNAFGRACPAKEREFFTQLIQYMIYRDV